MKPTLGSVLIALIVALVIAALSMFVVDQRQHALVFRLGEVIDVKKAPGLYFKVPLLDNVRYFDVRILTAGTMASGQATALLARALGHIDAAGVDRATAGLSARTARLLARLSQLADRRVWEGAIGKLDQGLHVTASGLSHLQTGLLHQYYALAATGIAVLFVYAFLILRF